MTNRQACCACFFYFSTSRGKTMVYQNAQEMIGNTPLVRLGRLGVPSDVRLFAKLELANLAGSVKDRVGKYMVEDAETRGLLHPGSTIIEPTAGNTGIGIAFAALGKGYRIICVIPTKFSEEKQQLVRALGAEVVNTPAHLGMQGASDKAKELLRAIPGSVMLGQFTNPANPRSHYETTGPEIWRDLEGRIDYVVLGAGSGGTFSGILRALKERNPHIQGVLADPVGSIIGGGKHADYRIEGIGNDFIAETMDMSLVDKVIKITDDEAFQATKLLATNEGIFAGSSSGAALSASLRLAREISSGTIVTVFPDRGDRYLSEHLFG
jgi:cysteine synthase A